MLFQLLEHVVEVDVEVGLLHCLHLQELLELFLFLIDLEPVHIVGAFGVRVELFVTAQVIWMHTWDSSLKLICLELCLGEVLVKSFVLAAFFGNLDELQLEDEELFDLLVWDCRQNLCVCPQGNHGQ